MRKMNKKGFTLIELLAILVILSILMTMTVVGFRSFIVKGNNTYYDDLEKNVKTAVIDYYDDHRNLYPKRVGNSNSLENIHILLVSEKYMEKIVDAKGISCTKGKAIVIKKGANQYEYKICLRCPSYDKVIGDSSLGC